MNGIVIGVAVGVGYLLGRTRKLKLVMALAASRVSGRLGKNPAGLVRQGTELLGSSPELKTLTDTARGRLLEAGKAAAVAAASSRIDALSDRIQERTRSLSRSSMPTRGAEPGDEGAEEGRSGRVEADEEEGGYDEEPVEGEREERPRRRPASARERPRPQHRGQATEAEDDEEAERPRRTRPAGRPPVRRTRR